MQNISSAVCVTVMMIIDIAFKFALERLALGIAVPVHATFNQVLSYAKVQPGDFELIGTLIQIYQDLNERRDWLTLHEQGKVYTVEYWLQVLGKDIVEFEQVGVAALKAVRKLLKTRANVDARKLLRRDRNRNFAQNYLASALYY